jgi:hypothetical protein
VDPELDRQEQELRVAVVLGPARQRQQPLLRRLVRRQQLGDRRVAAVRSARVSRVAAI